MTGDLALTQQDTSISSIFNGYADHWLVEAKGLGICVFLGCICHLNVVCVSSKVSQRPRGVLASRFLARGVLGFQPFSAPHCQTEFALLSAWGPLGSFGNFVICSRAFELEPLKVVADLVFSGKLLLAPFGFHGRLHGPELRGHCAGW